MYNLTLLTTSNSEEVVMAREDKIASFDTIDIFNT